MLVTLKGMLSLLLLIFNALQGSSDARRWHPLEQEAGSDDRCINGLNILSQLRLVNEPSAMA